MTEIRFYHLTKKPLDQALPDLLSRAMETGKKILIQMNDEAQIKPMSDHLWVCRRNGFFPHGIKGDKDAEMHPVWLTSENDNPNKAETLILTNVADRADTDKFGLVCEKTRAMILLITSKPIMAAGRKKHKVLSCFFHCFRLV